MKRIGSPNIQISLTSNVSDLVPSPFVQRFYIWNHQLSIHCFEEFESVKKITYDHIHPSQNNATTIVINLGCGLESSNTPPRALSIAPLTSASAQLGKKFTE